MASRNEPRIAEGLLWRLLDDNAVLVSPVEGEVRVLNGTGTVIWQQLLEKNSLEGIEEYLVTNYQVSREEARNDLFGFLNDLSERGIVIWEPAEI